MVAPPRVYLHRRGKGKNNESRHTEEKQTEEANKSEDDAGAGQTIHAAAGQHRLGLHSEQGPTTKVRR